MSYNPPNVTVAQDHISYQVQHTERIEMSQHLQWYLRTILRETHHQKVNTIKFIRAQYGIGLKEAKDIVDKLEYLNNNPTLGDLLHDKIHHRG